MKRSKQVLQCMISARWLLPCSMVVDLSTLLVGPVGFVTLDSQKSCTAQQCSCWGWSRFGRSYASMQVHLQLEPSAQRLWLSHASCFSSSHAAWMPATRDVTQLVQMANQLAHALPRLSQCKACAESVQLPDAEHGKRLCYLNMQSTEERGQWISGVWALSRDSTTRIHGDGRRAEGLVISMSPTLAANASCCCASSSSFSLYAAMQGSDSVFSCMAQSQTHSNGCMELRDDVLVLTCCVHISCCSRPFHLCVIPVCRLRQGQE